jgi:hypothetical protein
VKLPGRHHHEVKPRRRRLADDLERPASSVAYYSRRSDQEQNTGRYTRREAQKQVTNLGRYSATPHIVSLDGSSQSLLRGQAAYQSAAERLLAGSIWNRNKLTVDTGGLSRQLQHQFPELSSVSVTLPLLSHQPIIYVQTAQPALILVGDSGTYVLDTDGKALLSVSGNQAAEASFGLPIVVDQSGLQLALDRQVLPSGDVSFIQTVVAQLAARHLTVTSMTLPPAASELDVHVSGLAYYAKFNLQSGDARQQAGTYLATQSHLQSEHITPAQYIDVRVDGRAYYK